MQLNASLYEMCQKMCERFLHVNMIKQCFPQIKKHLLEDKQHGQKSFKTQTIVE